MIKKPFHPVSRPTDLESKAIFLEETLEKMQKSEAYWEEQAKAAVSNNWDVSKQRYARTKLKDLRKGITEVFQKCDIIWKDISNVK